MCQYCDKKNTRPHEDKESQGDGPVLHLDLDPLKKYVEQVQEGEDIVCVHWATIHPSLWDDTSPSERTHWVDTRTRQFELTIYARGGRLFEILSCGQYEKRHVAAFASASSANSAFHWAIDRLEGLGWEPISQETSTDVTYYCQECAKPTTRSKTSLAVNCGRLGCVVRSTRHMVLGSAYGLQDPQGIYRYGRRANGIWDVVLTFFLENSVHNSWKEEVLYHDPG